MERRRRRLYPATSTPEAIRRIAAVWDAIDAPSRAALVERWGLTRVGSALAAIAGHADHLERRGTDGARLIAPPVASDLLRFVAALDEHVPPGDDDEVRGEFRALAPCFIAEALSSEPISDLAAAVVFGPVVHGVVARRMAQRALLARGIPVPEAQELAAQVAIAAATSYLNALTVGEVA